MNNFCIKKSTFDEVSEAIDAHISSLAFPMDSYVEDVLLNEEIFCIRHDEKLVGYFVIEEQALQLFHVLREFRRYASELMERAVTTYSLQKIHVMSQDSQLCALLIEWDYTVERWGCWFTDSGAEVDRAATCADAVLRAAGRDDLDTIEEATDGCLNEEGGGFCTMEQRVDAGTIFILEDDGVLLGCGIVEYGRICKDYMSIGMFVCPQHRQKGVAKTILLQLKDYVYAQGKKPIAGCWYYNTLSRKSLESAGMVATSLGFMAVLGQKDRPPKRTGNPPGELVD